MTAPTLPTPSVYIEKSFVINQTDTADNLLPSGSVNLVTTEGTINGATSITDNQWHHVSITQVPKLKSLASLSMG